MNALPQGLPPPVHMLPQGPEFPLEIAAEWRFIIAVCAVANAVAFAVQAFFEGQALFSGGFVFLGLSALFGIYYFFQARSLEGHVIALADECGTKQQTIDRLVGENTGLQRDKGALQDQSRDLVAAISEWYAAATAVAEHDLPATQDRVVQARALVQKYNDLTRDIAALTREEAKAAQLAELTRQRQTNALESARLEQAGEQAQSREEAVGLRERTFDSKQAKFAQALRALGISAATLHQLSEAVSKVAEEVTGTARETARALNIGLEPPAEERGLGTAAFQRVLTMATPARPVRGGRRQAVGGAHSEPTSPVSPRTPLARQQTPPVDGEHE